MIAPGEEESSAVGVPEEPLYVLGEPAGLAEPADVEVGLIELDESAHQEGVVVEVSGKLRPPGTVGGQQATLPEQGVFRETCGALRRRKKLLLPQDPISASHGDDHQTVPAREDLVIAGGLPPLLS